MYRYTRLTFLREVGFWIAGLVIAAPMYILIVLSLKTPQEATDSPLSVPSHLNLANYRDALQDDGAAGVSFMQAFFNSVFTTTAVVTALIVLGAPAGYYLARRATRLSGAVFWAFVVGIILPAQLGLLPLFVAMTRLGLGGSRWALIGASIGHLLPLTVFLYTGFFRSLPAEYEEAAMVDGASRARVFCGIVFPLIRPVTATVAILCGLNTWNDFFTPLVLVGGTPNVTLPVAIQSFVGAYMTQWHLIFAGVVVAVAPVVLLYLGAQRHFIRGFATGLRG